MTVRSVDIVMTTTAPTELIDITERVNQAVRSAAIDSGFACVTTPHTTAALLVYQFQDALVSDLVELAERLVPRHAVYLHNDPRHSDCERNDAHAHLRAALFGRAVALAVSDGQVVLGPAQSIVFAEFDGPQTREVAVQITGEPVSAAHVPRDAAARS